MNQYISCNLQSLKINVGITSYSLHIPKKERKGEKMPVKLPDNLPAIELLKKENIFVMGSQRASTQDIRTMRILILNLMPLKITTETDFVRLLSNNPLQVEIDFLRLESHVSKNTSEEHLEMFYKGFGDIQDQYYDGMIITGAPVEMLDFEKVNYWEEIKVIFDWARKHVTSTLYICWASQAALYHFYGVEKVPLDKKLFGVFKHQTNDKSNPLFRGFDDEFFIPHSRHTTMETADILTKAGLEVLSESDQAGAAIIMSRGGREFYLTGHSEYSPCTLDDEYRRDVDKGMDIEVPANYYKDDNPAHGPLVKWAGHANLLFNNWMNYFVYQETPYNLEEIQFLEDIKING